MVSSHTKSYSLENIAFNNYNNHEICLPEDINLSQNNRCSQIYDEQLTSDLRHLPSKLAEKSPFAFMDLRLKEDDLKSIKEFDVSSSKAYIALWNISDFCDHFNGIDNFIKLISKSSSASSATSVSSLIFQLFSARLEVEKDKENKIIQILIRATANDFTEENIFNLNWHTDPCNSGSKKCTEEFGFSFVLKGDTTLFYNGNSIDLYQENGGFSSPKAEDIVYSRSDQAVIFAMGEEGAGALHSAPTHDANGRLFSLITIRNKEETIDLINSLDIKSDDNTIYDIAL